MLIISGYLTVAEPDRDHYVDRCREVVRAARVAPGCLDFSITADSIDPQRVIISERWATEAELLAFRHSDPDSELDVSFLDADVRRYLISSVTDA